MKKSVKKNNFNLIWIIIVLLIALGVTLLLYNFSKPLIRFSPPNNIVVNPSFDSWNGNTLNSWSTNTSFISRYNSDKVSGNYSLYLIRGAYGYTTGQNFNVNPGDSYTFEVWMKKISGSDATWARVVSLNNYSWQQVFFQYNLNSWNKFSRNFTIPSGTTQVRIELGGGTNIIALFDDTSLSNIVSISTSSTSNCNDSDGGQNILIQGTTSVSGLPPYLDSCLDSNTLNEWYCSSSNGPPGSVQITCPIGYSCKNGACVVSNVVVGNNISVIGFNNSAYGNNISVYGNNNSIYGSNVSVSGNNNTIIGNNIVSRANNLVIARSGSSSCSDSDVNSQYPDGKNPLIQGTAGIPGVPSWIDQCIDSKNINEGFCGGQTMGIGPLSCPQGYSCKNGACLSDYSCSDSDGGQNIYVQGTLSIPGLPLYFDDCADANTVNEWYCDPSGPPGQVQLSCPIGYSCSNGACVQKTTICTDSDGGNNINVKGTTALTGGINDIRTDYCTDSKTVFEWICDKDSSGNDYLRGFASACPYGYFCSDGACINQFSCIDSDGGKNYNQWGEVSKVDDNSGSIIRYPDACDQTNPNYLWETYCDSGNNVQAEKHYCNHGCVGGTCAI